LNPRDDSGGTARHRFGFRTALVRIERTVVPVTCVFLGGGMRLVVHADETIMLSVDAFRRFAL
jgi:hypothetical protein